MNTDVFDSHQKFNFVILSIAGNLNLAGSMPSEIRQMTALTSLYLGKWE